MRQRSAYAIGSDAAPAAQVAAVVAAAQACTAAAGTGILTATSLCVTFTLSRDYNVRLLNETIAGCEGQDIRNWKSEERGAPTEIS